MKQRVDAHFCPSELGPYRYLSPPLDVLVSIEAHGDPEGYLFRRGWCVARRLHKVGL